MVINIIAKPGNDGVDVPLDLTIGLRVVLCREDVLNPRLLQMCCKKLDVNCLLLSDNSSGWALYHDPMSQKCFATDSAVTELRQTVRKRSENRSDITKRYFLYRGVVTNSPKMSMATKSSGVRAEKIFISLLSRIWTTQFLVYGTQSHVVA